MQPPTAPCRLCLKTRELRDSHLMPKGLYRFLTKSAQADGETNPVPITVTPGIAVQTSKQVKDYLLCSSCEDLLNKSGEDWVMRNCWRAEDDFRLRDTLETATPLHLGKDGWRLYSGKNIAAIDIAKLIHFAAGVFWRAGAHSWSAAAGPPPVKLELGPYEEQLRQFVLGKAGFPADAVLFINVTASAKSEVNEHVLFPYLQNHTRTFRQYMFAIPGITFQMFVGKGISAELRSGCAAHSPNGYIWLAPNDFTLAAMTKLVRNAVPKGVLASS